MTAKKANASISPETIALYDKLIDTIPAIERKGDKVPYTSFNGHMFTFLSSNGTLAVRLPEKERTDFIKKYKSTLMESYGIIMKEYVAVPGSLLKKTSELKTYLRLSYDYIKTLKPKPTKKASSAKSKKPKMED